METSSRQIQINANDSYNANEPNRIYILFIFENAVLSVILKQ